jgi:hypothetical protein
MQLALRSSAIASAAVVGASIVAMTPVAPSLPDIQVRSTDVQLASLVDTAASTLGGLIDAGLQQVQTYVDDAVVGIGYAAYGLLTELSTGLDDLGATSLGSAVLALADDAINTSITVAPITDLFNELEALVNALGLNSIGLGSAASDAAASLAADATDATTLGGLIDAGLNELESSLDQGIIGIGYAAYGLLTELSTGLDDLGATSLGADVLTLANDAIDTQITVAPITDVFDGLETLVADLGLNSVPL